MTTSLPPKANLEQLKKQAKDLLKAHRNGDAAVCEALVKQLAVDLTAKFGRGFSARNLWQIRKFYKLWPIVQTAFSTLMLKKRRAPWGLRQHQAQPQHWPWVMPLQSPG